MERSDLPHVDESIRDDLWLEMQECLPHLRDLDFTDTTLDDWERCRARVAITVKLEEMADDWPDTEERVASHLDWLADTYEPELLAPLRGTRWYGDGCLWAGDLAWLCGENHEACDWWQLAIEHGYREDDACLEAAQRLTAMGVEIDWPEYE